jgi:hypothetical protein
LNVGYGAEDVSTEELAPLEAFEVTKGAELLLKIPLEMPELIGRPPVPVE